MMILILTSSVRYLGLLGELIKLTYIHTYAYVVLSLLRGDRRWSRSWERNGRFLCDIRKDTRSAFSRMPVPKPSPLAFGVLCVEYIFRTRRLDFSRHVQLNLKAEIW